MRKKGKKHDSGIYLVNMVRWWGAHPPETLLVYLSSIKSHLNDFLIEKGKNVAKEMGLDPFGLVHVNLKQEHTLLYTHKT